jgi:beta-glucosidase
MDYRNPKLPTAKRVEDLLKRMTVEEKIGQLVQLDTYDDGLEQVRKHHAGSFANMLDLKAVRRFQEYSVKRTRLKIPIIFEFDAIHGHAFWPGATVFPTPLAMSSSWNPALLREVAAVTAKEVAVTGAHQVFSPVLCLPRDMRWGRVDETFGEDPYLIGELGAAMVEGYQGRGVGGRYSVASTLKHFAGYGETLGGRDGADADHGKRKMLALFLPPFKKVCAKNPYSVMIAYHNIDGVPCVTNRWLLTHVLKDKWGFKGYTRTDWNNSDMLVYLRHNAHDLDEAYERSVKAGTDVVSCSPMFLEVAPRLVKSGRLPEEYIDNAVRRVLRLKFDLGLMDGRKLYPDAAGMKRFLNCPAHRKVALKAARESIVLLKNANETLPLNPAKLKKIAVVGASADDYVVTLGDWAWLKNGAWTNWPEEHKRSAVVTLLDGIKAICGRKTAVKYAFGCDAMLDRNYSIEHAWNQPTPKHALVKKQSDIPAAVLAARDADVIIAGVGDSISTMGEGRDRAQLGLPGDQMKLLEAMKALGKPLIVVLLNSKPLTIPWVVENADAIIEAWNPGCEGGRAVAEALFGKVNPSGKLTVSWPVHVGQQPVFYNSTPGWHGQQTYVDMRPEPLFPFGFGLSYTSYQYSNLRVRKNVLKSTDTIQVSVDVKNTGKRTGVEIVELYVNDVVSSVSTPIKEIKGFARVALKPREKKTVTIRVPVADLALVNEDHEVVVEAGEFEVMVGPSSKDSDLLKTVVKVRDSRVLLRY